MDSHHLDAVDRRGFPVDRAGQDAQLGETVYDPVAAVTIMDQYDDPEATGIDKLAPAVVERLARAGFVDGDQARLVDRGVALGLAGFGEARPLYLILGRNPFTGVGGLAMLDNARRKPTNDEMRNKQNSLSNAISSLLAAGPEEPWLS